MLLIINLVKVREENYTEKVFLPFFIRISPTIGSQRQSEYAGATNQRCILSSVNAQLVRVLELKVFGIHLQMRGYGQSEIQYPGW